LITITPRQLERLQALLDALEPIQDANPRDVFEADRAFHTIVVEASGHQRIRDIIGTLSDQIQRLRYLSAAQPERAARAHKEHRAVAAALLARDPEAAQAAMRVHLRHSQEVLLQLVGYQAAWESAGNGA
jgi:DNA-binding GntR family transcriptional regulator